MNASATGSYSYRSSFTTPLALVSTAAARKNARRLAPFSPPSPSLQSTYALSTLNPYARPSLFATRKGYSRSRGGSSPSRPPRAARASPRRKNFPRSSGNAPSGYRSGGGASRGNARAAAMSASRCSDERVSEPLGRSSLEPPGRAPSPPSPLRPDRSVPASASSSSSDSDSDSDSARGRTSGLASAASAFCNASSGAALRAEQSSGASTLAPPGSIRATPMQSGRRRSEGSRSLGVFSIPPRSPPSRLRRLFVARRDGVRAAGGMILCVREDSRRIHAPSSISAHTSGSLVASSPSRASSKSRWHTRTSRAARAPTLDRTHRRIASGPARS